MAHSKNVLTANKATELLSYVINSDPVLSAEIDLPVQGQSIKEFGKLIIDNQRYKNAFINTINLIGLTVIKRNAWSSPWDFTNRGVLRYGQSVREMILDLVDAQDYNTKFTDKDAFLDTYVPDVYQFIHDINFQKFYATTTSDAQLAMAFESEDGLFDFIDKAVGMLWESLEYDRYIINKYMLCRRILDGTVTPVYMSSYATMTNRERVAAMKSVSNKMSFRSPNYNPAGIRKATNFDDQILIMNTDFEADFTTDVLATSFFRDEADYRARLVLIDGFDNHDDARLSEVLGSAYDDFSVTELGYLAKIPAVLVSREWFMDYVYAMDAASAEYKTTEFYNPTTLENNHFLHFWGVFATSPFENAAVFTSQASTVTSVTVSPSTASVVKGTPIKLTATVAKTGFANKGVLWSTGDATKAIVDQYGNVTTLAATATNTPVVITATSIFDSTVTGTASITITNS